MHRTPLTYMSISSILQSNLRSGRLIKLTSPWGDSEAPRSVYVPANIARDLNFVPDDSEESCRIAELVGWLEAFMEHCELTVSENPDLKPPDVMMARVHPIEGEFWSIRVTVPEEYPGIRAIGAFVCKDEFVILAWDYRESIGDAFDEEVAVAMAEWTNIFGQIGPFKGDKLDEYLTNYIAV